MIPDAAVEAALSALFPDRETVSDFSRAVQFPSIRTILEAAGPHLTQAAKAEAWGEGWDAGAGWPQIEDNPYRTAK